MTKYMLIMRGTDESNAAMMADIEELMATTRQFIEDTVKAGVFLAAEGLDDPSIGVVVDFSGETPVVTDGPYGETKELFGGFFLLDVASKEEAVEWAKRCPGVDCRVEVRPIWEMEDFSPEIKEALKVYDEDLHAELARPQLPELVSGPEAAEILGVSVQRVHQLAAEHADFPAPAYKLRAASLWLRPAIVSFAERWDRKRGRPRKEPGS